MHSVLQKKLRTIPLSAQDPSVSKQHLTHVSGTDPLDWSHWSAHKLYLIFVLVFGVLTPAFLLFPTAVCNWYLFLSVTSFRLLLVSNVGALFTLQLSLIYFMQTAVINSLTRTDVYRKTGMIAAVGSTCLWTVRVFSRGALFSDVYFFSMSVLQLFPCIAFLLLHGVGVSVRVLTDLLSELFDSAKDFKSAALRWIGIGCLVYSVVSVVNPSLVVFVMWNEEADALSQFLVRQLGILRGITGLTCILLSGSRDQEKEKMLLSRRLSVVLSFQSVALIASTVVLTRSIFADDGAGRVTGIGWMTNVAIHGAAAVIGAYAAVLG